MSGVLGSMANWYRDNVELSAEEIRHREHGKNYLELTRAAAVVVVAVIAIFTFAFPNIFTIALTLLAGIAAKDTFQLTDNFREMLDDYSIELQCRNSNKFAFNQATKNTWLVRPILLLSSANQP